MFNRQKVVRPLPVPHGSNVRWQQDLIDMGERSMHQNRRYRYVLTVVDVFSKRAWARPLRTKEADNVTTALEDVLLENGTAPQILQSDNGGKFRNGWMSELCERYEMKQVFGAPYRPQSQGAIERFNQTLKRALYSHMTRYNTGAWLQVLPFALENYNHTYHQSIGTTPYELHQSQNAIEIEESRSRLLNRNRKWVRKYQKPFREIHVGDAVRVSNLIFKDYRRKGRLSTKSYTPNWTRDIYTVVSISDPRDPTLMQPTYTVESDETGRRLVVFRDNLQLLPSRHPRRTVAAPAPLEDVPPYSLPEEPTETEVDNPPRTEAGQRSRRPSVLLRDYLLL
eukprot:TRINITY_DN10379_c0_g1_i1.p2 TRINITY_DN10379_c0_g1~~TRINITY_DN10379_c0_g1_i1.p2  ORF type:complete len:338 (+),score=36.91 TRINITY_DN10379_c0_g1_i1:553-1566(+)